MSVNAETSRLGGARCQVDYRKAYNIPKLSLVAKNVNIHHDSSTYFPVGFVKIQLVENWVLFWNLLSCQS